LIHRHFTSIECGIEDSICGKDGPDAIHRVDDVRAGLRKTMTRTDGLPFA